MVSAHFVHLLSTGVEANRLLTWFHDCCQTWQLQGSTFHMSSVTRDALKNKLLIWVRERADVSFWFCCVRTTEFNFYYSLVFACNSALKLPYVLSYTYIPQNVYASIKNEGLRRNKKQTHFRIYGISMDYMLYPVYFNVTFTLFTRYKSQSTGQSLFK